MNTIIDKKIVLTQLSNSIVCIRRRSTIDFSGFHIWKLYKILRVSCESNVGIVACACFCSSRVEAGAGAVGGASITLS